MIPNQTIDDVMIAVFQTCWDARADTKDIGSCWAKCWAKLDPGIQQLGREASQDRQNRLVNKIREVAAAQAPVVRIRLSFLEPFVAWPTWQEGLFRDLADVLGHHWEIAYKQNPRDLKEKWDVWWGELPPRSRAGYLNPHPGGPVEVIGELRRATERFADWVLWQLKDSLPFSGWPVWRNSIR